MANENELFDQQIHDAFERIELSGDAQERMLANLLAAQAQAEGMRQEPSAEATVGRHMAQPEKAPAEEEPRADDGKVIKMRPKRTSWRTWLPLAAVLAVAFVVVRITGIAERGALDTASQETFNAMTVAEDEGKAESAEDGIVSEESSDDIMAMGPEATELAESAPVEMEMSANADSGAAEEAYVPSDRDLGGADYYPSIKLEDGRWLTTLRDGLYVDEVDASRVGALVGKGMASAFDAGEQEATIACEVFELIDEPDAFAVRYEGEDSFWRCTVVD